MDGQSRDTDLYRSPIRKNLTLYVIYSNVAEEKNQCFQNWVSCSKLEKLFVQSHVQYDWMLEMVNFPVNLDSLHRLSDS